MIHRLLLVDDYEPWRRYLRAALETHPEWQVSEEAADGLDAVHKAHNLGPDLILLDVGLPGISGIDAARRIFDHDPAAQILFVSEHRSWEIAEAALATGARGYVLKSDAGRELPLAMHAVVTGERFVSPRLGGAPLLDDANPARRTRTPRHEAAFLDDEVLVEGYADFAETALNAGNSCVALASRPRLARLERALRQRGVDVASAVREGRYLADDVAAALSTFIVDGWPEERRFWSGSMSLFMRAARAAKGLGARVAAFGECAPTLWSEGRGDAALRLERLWDELAQTCDVELYCGYPALTARDPECPFFRQLCAQHSVVHAHP